MGTDIFVKDSNKKYVEHPEREKKSVYEASDTIQKKSPADIQKPIKELYAQQSKPEIQDKTFLEDQDNLEGIRNKYSKHYDLSPVADFTLNESGLIIGANLTAASMLDSNRNHLIQKQFFDVVSPEFCNIFFEHFKQVLATNTKQACELKLVKKDGESFYVRMESIVMPDNEYNCNQFRTIIIDIDKRKKAEIQLKESETCYRLLLENARDVIWTADLELHFTYLSPSIKKLRGFTIEESILQPLDEMFTPASVELMKKNLATQLDVEAKNAGSLHNTLILELELICKDKSIIFIEVSSAFLKNQDGEAYGIVGIARDITGRRKAEEEKTRLQDELRQAYKMEAIGTLAGGVAHDFNNILGIILANSELAISDIKNQDYVQDSLNHIRQASLRAKEIVKQILIFSRQTSCEHKPIEMSSLIQEAYKLLRPTTPTSIEIRLNITSQFDTVMADPAQMDQVLINLCVNSVHAMKENGGVLDIELTDEIIDGKKNKKRISLSPGRYLKLIVRDTGYGMNAETLERIFDPYFTTRPPGEGTGMGLPVVQGIIKNHGGEIIMYSKPGKGTTATIYLPVAEAENKSESVISEHNLPTGNERILLVDDEEALLYAGNLILKRSGYQVVSTRDPIKALKKFRKQPDFDLVISDMAMPHMTGDVLAAEIMKIRPDIPVIICTGFNEHMNEEKAASLGIQAFILKPFSRNDLVKTVRKVLDKNPAV